MEYGRFQPTIIQDPSKVKQRENKVMDGVIQSAMLTAFQKQSIDGLIESAIPGGKKSEPALTNVKASKTKQSIGNVHFPGSKFS